jgi:hypothetical protein
MKKIIIICIIIFCASSLSATKYAGEFLNLGVGVKAIGMGNSFVAIADDPTAVYWNTAGMQFTDEISLDLMHAEQFDGELKYDTFSMIYPFENNDMRIGFLLTRIGISDIPITALEDPEDTSTVYVDKYVDDSEYTCFLGFSSSISPKISWGVGSKFIYKDNGVMTATGLGLDIGFLFNISEKVDIGVNLRDIFSSPIWWDNNTTERIYPSILAGVATDFTFPIINRPARLGIQSDILFEGYDYAAQLNYKDISMDFHIGVEIKLADFISLLAGIERENPTAGISLAYKRFTVNYAFHSHSDLNSTHRVSIGASF